MRVGGPQRISHVKAFIGIDVQIARACPYAVLDRDGAPVTSGWLGRGTGTPAPAALRDLAQRLADQTSSRAAVGIDAPRLALPSRRRFNWTGERWQRLPDGDGRIGRHCEVVLKAHETANPQWTPLADKVPDWMKVGFELFAAVEDVADVYEVFPSASYRLLKGERSARLTLDLSECSEGPKDMLDAHIAAFTVREYLRDAGEMVGGGDGLGAIVLPRRITRGRKGSVFEWPESRQ